MDEVEVQDFSSVLSLLPPAPPLFPREERLRCFSLRANSMLLLY